MRLATFHGGRDGGNDISLGLFCSYDFFKSMLMFYIHKQINKDEMDLKHTHTKKLTFISKNNITRVNRDRRGD